MSPADLAQRYPFVFHVTELGSVPMIARYGLRTAKDLGAVDPFFDERLLSKIREIPLEVQLPCGRVAILNDQSAMQEAALSSCLQGGLDVSDWLSLLAERIFFWTAIERVENFIRARLNGGRGASVLCFSTLPLAEQFSDRIELSPINSGSTIRKPAKRDRTTFSSMLDFTYSEWTQRRGHRDRVAELVVRGSIDDWARFCCRLVQIESADALKEFCGEVHACLNSSYTARH